MSTLIGLKLSESEKLEVLNRFDEFRKWRSLDDKRYCLVCGKIIDGQGISVIGGSRGAGPLRVICATERCESIPMDWVRPTDEVLSKKSASAEEKSDQVGTVMNQPRIRENSIAISLRGSAIPLKQSA